MLVGFIFLVVIASVVINVADTALHWGILPWHTVTAQVDSGDKIITKVYDPDRAMAQYSWFKQKHEDILATEKNIGITKNQVDQFKADNGNMSGWDSETKQTYRQMNTVYTGQQEYYSQLISDYNSAASDITKNIYLKGLPAKVDRMLWT